MNKPIKSTKSEAKQKYVKPSTKKHEPVKIVQGSGGCGSLYYTSLYKYFG